VNIRVENLPCTIEFDVVAPSFLAEPDHPWLQRMIERASAAEGLRAGDVDAHLLAPLAIPAPPQKQRLAAYILAKQLTTKTAAPFIPREARERVFVAAAQAKSTGTDNVTPLDDAKASKFCVHRSTSSLTSSGRRASSMRPVVTRATSSKSSTRRVRCSDCRLSTPTCLRLRTGSSMRSRPATASEIAASGLRSSWPSIARK
jgi:hypothetical protein